MRMLCDALERLTLQRLSASEFEVIVADDGSSDATKAVAKSFSGRLRMKYHLQEDLGFRADEEEAKATSGEQGGPSVFIRDGNTVFRVRTR
jgi:hypothetical protein